MIEEKKLKTKNPREAAYLALLESLRKEAYISEILAKWYEIGNPSPQDARLAREIAFGTSRMALALDYMAEQIAHLEKLSLKLKERVILRMAIYQHRFMDKIPDYAINNESVKLAKLYCYESFVKFLNAVLRRLPEEEIELPQGNTVPEISIRYSYPTYLVQELIQNYGLSKAINIMEAENTPSSTMFRIRPESKCNLNDQEGLELLSGTQCRIGVIKDLEQLQNIAASKEFYIQNATPACLIDALAKNQPAPDTILDLCASPGGKLIAAHDYFPNATLVANDVSEEKLKPLSENLVKYQIPATLTISRGEKYPTDQKFDLILLDVPCSNSGVLNKRPEARWRIDENTLNELEEMQLNLIEHAAKNLLTDTGEIWYLTCSILKRENERLIRKACEQYGLTLRMELSILPNTHGWDGGYCAALTKSS